MTNHELAKRYIAKQELMGCNILELELVENDGVILKKVNDSNSRSIVIPSFITGYSNNRGISYKPFNYTMYEEIIIESNAGDIHGLFSGVLSLELDIKFMSDINLTSISYLFHKVINAMKINIEFKGKVGVSGITSIDYLYSECRALNEVDIGWLKGANITSSSNLFDGCVMLKRIKGLELLNTVGITDMSYMFSSCRLLKEINLDNFKYDNVYRMSGMFGDCLSLNGVKIRGDLSDVVDMSTMFKNCISLEYVDFDGTDIGMVSELGEMFKGCVKIKELDLSCISSSYIHSMSGIFYGCELLERVNLSGIKFNEMLDSGYDLVEYSGCRDDYKDLEMGTGDYYEDEWYNEIGGDEVDLDSMFYGCERLKELILSKGDRESVVAYSVPSGCKVV